MKKQITVLGTVREVRPDERNDTVEIKLNAGSNVEAVLNMVGGQNY